MRIPAKCPICKSPFDQFLAGRVFSTWRLLLLLPAFLVLCRDCKGAIGYERRP